MNLSRNELEVEGRDTSCAASHKRVMSPPKEDYTWKPTKSEQHAACDEDRRQSSTCTWRHTSVPNASIRPRQYAVQQAMSGRVRLRPRYYRCLKSLAAVLLLSSISSTTAVDDNNNNGQTRAKGGQAGQGQQQPPPPLPGQLSTIDEGNQLLVSGVKIPSKGAVSNNNNNADENGGDKYNGRYGRQEDQAAAKMRRRGMLYHYEPMLPPYMHNADAGADGRQYWKEEEEEILPTVGTVPVPASEQLSNGGIIEEGNNKSGGENDVGGEDSVVATEADRNADDEAADQDRADEKHESEEDKEASSSSSLNDQEEDESQSQPATEDVPDDNVDSEIAMDGVVDDAIDEVDNESADDASADVADEQMEKGDAETKEDEPLPPSLADDIVGAAMLLDESAIEAIAEELIEAEGGSEIDIIETDMETIVKEESQPPPTVGEVESPKASDNSYVAAEKSAMPQINGGGEIDSSSALPNATALASDRNASQVQKPPGAADGENSDKTNDLTTDDIGDSPADDEHNAMISIDNSDRSTDTVGIDIESDGPSRMLEEGTANARRIAEEKGVPTNIESNDSPSAATSAANATNDDTLTDEDAPTYDDDADATEEELTESRHNESLPVTQENDEPLAPKVDKDHESWRGVYDRELDDEETRQKGTKPNKIADDTKRTDISSLDNVREYIASNGEESTGLMPTEGMPNQDNDAVASESDAEFGGLDVDASDGINSNHDVESNDDDLSDGENAEASSEDSVDLNDVPDISSFRNSFSSSNVNSNFIDGIDDLDKFLEEVDTPDELDVAHGTSMQEVLVGKGVQILVKKANAVVRRVKSIASKVKYRIGNSIVAAKIREGIETSGIIALGEKVREASNISEHKERVAGIGQKIGQVLDEKIDAMNKMFDDLMENDIVQSVGKVVDRIKANALVRRIISALGLSDDDDDDDDVMDFSSFSSGSGTDSSLEDRLAAMRKMY